ncbi:MAG: hypothetical protein WHT65_01170 [Pseudothermotoga sp.]
MKRVFFLIVLLVCVHLFAYVPATADYVVILRDLETINSFLPEVGRFGSVTKGFVCFFGKLSLNLPTLAEFFETEELENAQNLLDVSIVTDDPQWVEQNLSQLLENREVVQKTGLHYFVAPSMVEDVKAMISGELPAFELPQTANIYVKVRSVPIIGIVLHLLGFGEGIPVEDEVSINLESEMARILVKASKETKFDWELKKAQSTVIAKGLKVLRDSELTLVMSTSILSQIPPEISEEVGVELGELEFIFSKARSISLSMSDDMSKVALFFDLQEEGLNELVKTFEELEASVKKTDDFVYVSVEELTGIFPTKGGIAQILSNNVDEKELIPVESGIIGKISFKQEDSFVDLSISRENASVLINAIVSKSAVLYAFKEIFSEFLPKPPEIKLIKEIVDYIDQMCYYMYLDPPETLNELADVIPPEFVDRLTYEREEADEETWIITIGVKSDLVNSLTEDDVMDALGYSVDAVYFDVDNGIIFVSKNYEKAEPLSTLDIIEDLVTGIRWYYEDYESAPENLNELINWYLYSPEWVLDLVTYEQTTEGETTTIKLQITTGEELDLQALSEKYDLTEVSYEEGVLTIVFELP